MAVKTRGNSTGTYSSSVSSITISVPSGVQNGDLLLAFINCANPQTLNTPTGWTAIGAGLGTNGRQQAYYRVASSEPASYAFTSSASSSTLAGQMVALYDDRGAALSVDVNAYSGPPNSTTATPPTVTPGQNYEAIVIRMNEAANDDVRMPPGWITLADSLNHGKAFGNAVTCMLPLDATTSYTNPTFVANSGISGTWIACTLGIKGATNLPTQNIQMRGYATLGNASSNSVTVSVPSGTTDGDFMIASIQPPIGGTITPPAGWSVLQTFSTNLGVTVYTKVASSEPASYTWNFSNTGGNNGTIMSFFAGTSSVAVDASNMTQLSAGATSYSTPTLTPNYPLDMLLSCYQCGSSRYASIPDGQFIVFAGTGRTFSLLTWPDTSTAGGFLGVANTSELWTDTSVLLYAFLPTEGPQSMPSWRRPRRFRPRMQSKQAALGTTPTPPPPAVFRPFINVNF